MASLLGTSSSRPPWYGGVGIGTDIHPRQGAQLLSVRNKFAHLRPRARVASRWPSERRAACSGEARAVGTWGGHRSRSMGGWAAGTSPQIAAAPQSQASPVRSGGAIVPALAAQPTAPGISRPELTCRRNRAACQSSAPTATPRRVLWLCLSCPASLPSAVQSREPMPRTGRGHMALPTRGRDRACWGRGRASTECPCMLGVGGVAVLLGRGHVVRRLSCWWRAQSRRWGVATRLYLPLLFGVGSWWLCCWGAAWTPGGGSACSRPSDDTSARRKRKRFPALRGR